MYFSCSTKLLDLSAFLRCPIIRDNPNRTKTIIIDSILKNVSCIQIGYLTDAGKMNLKHFEIFMEEMGEIDRELFRDHYSDLQQLDTNNVS